MGIMTEDNWFPLLQMPGGTWVGFIHIDGEQVWVGSYEIPKRPLDLNQPIGLLPLLEQPLSVVAAELEELNERGYTIFSSVLTSSLPRIVDAAVTMQSRYWAERALDWMEALGPRDVTYAELEQVIDARWASQHIRHKALQLKKRWKKMEI